MINNRNPVQHLILVYNTSHRNGNNNKYCIIMKIMKILLNEPPTHSIVEKLVDDAHSSSHTELN